MLIQFDREDSETLVLTFDNSDADVEQMEDFISWLEVSGLEYNKLKMKIPGVVEKVTNLFVKKAPVQKSVPVSVPVSVSVSAPVQVKKSVPVETLEETDTDTQDHVVANSGIVEAEESSSDSESEEEQVSRTKKTTKRVASSRK
jgi:hypothetical protein